MQRKSLVAKSPKPATPSTDVKRKSLAKTPKPATPSIDGGLRRKSVGLIPEPVGSASKKRKSTPLEDTPGKRKSLKKQEVQEEVDDEDLGSDDDDSDVLGSDEELGSDDDDLGSAEDDLDSDEELGSDEEGEESGDDLVIREAEEGETDSEDEDEEEEEETKQGKPQKKNAEKKPKPEKKKKDKKEKIDEPEKTVFVGNLPKEMDKVQLKKIFSKYGTVASVRLRSAPVADPRTPKKVAVIKKDFHPERSNINAYIVFATEEMAKEALKANGTEVGGHHIRVDKIKQMAPDNKKAVFIGNVPFDADEEKLRKVFESCGKISSVRIIRDRTRGLGKGFAYINFESSDCVELALMKNGAELDKRPLRVQRSQEKPSRHRAKKQGLKQQGEFKGQKPSQAGKGGKKRNRKPKPRFLTANGEKAPVAFQGKKVAEGKVQKKKKNAKLNPKKQAAIETLAKSLPGSAKKDKRKSIPA